MATRFLNIFLHGQLTNLAFLVISMNDLLNALSKACFTNILTVFAIMT